MSQVQTTKVMKIGKPIEKSQRTRKSATSILQKIKSRKIPNEAFSMI